MRSQFFVKHISSPRFVEELHKLLITSGITPYRLPVCAEINSAKDWQEPSDEPLDQKIGKGILYMDDHLSEELSLDKLAEKIDLS